MDDPPCKSLSAPSDAPSSMLACLALPAAAPAAAVVSANAAYTQRLQAPKPETGNASVVKSQAPRELFDLGSSLLLDLLGCFFVFCPLILGVCRCWSRLVYVV